MVDSMREIVYFVGAGLSKSLQLDPCPIPAMWDFVSTMAKYLDDNIVLTTMAELENAGLFEHGSEEASLLAKKLVGHDRTPATRAAFREVLERRTPESIENLLERSLGISDGQTASSMHQRFKYAISRLFCLIGTTINWSPLERFIRTQTGLAQTHHTFVSFNYDLILDSAVQKHASWTPAWGYGFRIPYGVSDDLPQDAPADWVDAIPLSDIRSEAATILKPHGSLNWLLPYQGPYRHSPHGIDFLESPVIVPVTKSGIIRNWCSSHDFQRIAVPDLGWPEVGICILPPSSAKHSNLPFFKASRDAEVAAVACADQVLVIGWSLPKTDRDQEILIEEAMKSREKPLEKLTVVNRNASAEYFNDVATLFRIDPQRMETHNAGFVDFVSARCP